MVQSCIRGPSGRSFDTTPTAAMLIKALDTGFVIAELEVLRASFDLPMEQLARLLGISKATLTVARLLDDLIPPSPTASCASHA